ncbi:helix-turn-helix domain-containing protein [uncultured Lacinutrix sp.]|uniref:helix-turn-helix domain-containing protein n=1 Tax=uncultured Lacinutrix sp. TaxID=574032 RepID=UPI0026326A41|nr:helix-turn-helix domain-containing protein [uncultured Lacinutrix sp.]
MTFKPQFRNSLLNFCSILIVVLFNLKGYSQAQKTYAIPDSLKDKTYKELYKQNNISAEKGDSIRRLFYAKMYLHKAKNENDTIRIAHGFSQHVQLSNHKTSIIYADSIITLTNSLNNYYYPGYGYMVKGISYYNLSYYNKALENYLIAQDYAINNNNGEHLSYITEGIGDIKLFWGNYNEALLHFKSQLNYLIKNDNTYTNRQNYNTLIHKLANCHIQLKQLDSALFYTKKGYENSTLNKNDLWKYSFAKQAGYIAYYNNNFKNALDSINKGKVSDERANEFINTAYYKGKIYNKLKDSTKALYYFKKADSIYSAHPEEIIPEVRDVQEYFVKYYAKQKEVDSQLVYVERLLHVDSIVDSYKKELNETIIKEYDRPKLLAEKQNIINSLERKKTRLRLYIISLITGLFVLLGFTIRFYYKKNLYKKRFRNFISTNSEIEKKEDLIITPKNPLQGVSQDVIEAILKQLEVFENENNYLDNSITLGNLAKALNTNSSYLSKIINHYKQKNFNAYLTDLRIDYCIATLKTNKTIRSYTIKAIAEQVGFKNSESFSKAFYKKTGIYPSFFIKQIDKQDKSE